MITDFSMTNYQLIGMYRKVGSKISSELLTKTVGKLQGNGTAFKIEVYPPGRSGDAPLAVQYACTAAGALALMLEIAQFMDCEMRVSRVIEGKAVEVVEAEAKAEMA